MNFILRLCDFVGVLVMILLISGTFAIISQEQLKKPVEQKVAVIIAVALSWVAIRFVFLMWLV